MVLTGLPRGRAKAPAAGGRAGRPPPARVPTGCLAGSRERCRHSVSASRLRPSQPQRLPLGLTQFPSPEIGSDHFLKSPLHKGVGIVRVDARGALSNGLVVGLQCGSACARLRYRGVLFLSGYLEGPLPKGLCREPGCSLTHRGGDALPKNLREHPLLLPCFRVGETCFQIQQLLL